MPKLICGVNSNIDDGDDGGGCVYFSRMWKYIDDLLQVSRHWMTVRLIGRRQSI